MSGFNLDNYLNQPEYNDDYVKNVIRSAYAVIDRLEGWNIVKDFGSDPNNSFMWSKNNDINNIMSAINDDYGGHSGASLACLMRNMYQISLLKMNQ